MIFWGDIAMTMLSGPRGPFTCGVFLTQTDVFLEGELGKEIFAGLAQRGPSRFGQINCWVNGASPVDAAQKADIAPERVDLIIFAGFPEDLLPRITQFAPAINYSTTVALVITAAQEKDLASIKQKMPQAVFINLRPEKSYESVKVADSILALNYYYENALSQFSLFDLRYLWPPGATVEAALIQTANQFFYLNKAQKSSFSFPPALEALEETAAETLAIEPLTGGRFDLSQGNHLLVLRGVGSPSAEKTAYLWEKLTASLSSKGDFLWYAVGLPPSSQQPEIMLFSPAYLT